MQDGRLDIKIHTQRFDREKICAIIHRLFVILLDRKESVIMTTEQKGAIKIGVMKLIRERIMPQLYLSKIFLSINQEQYDLLVKHISCAHDEENKTNELMEVLEEVNKTPMARSEGKLREDGKNTFLLIEKQAGWSFMTALYSKNPPTHLFQISEHLTIENEMLPKSIHILTGESITNREKHYFLMVWSSEMSFTAKILAVFLFSILQK